MKRILSGLMMILAVATGTANATSPTEDCSHLTQMMNAAGEKMSKAGAAIYDEYVAEPDKSALEECLGGIGGGGLNLGIPGLPDLFNEACSRLRQEVGSHLGQLNQSQSIEVLDGIASVGTSSGEGVVVTDTSSRVRDAVWRAIE